MRGMGVLLLAMKGKGPVTSEGLAPSDEEVKPEYVSSPTACSPPCLRIIMGTNAHAGAQTAPPTQEMRKR